MSSCVAKRTVASRSVGLVGVFGLSTVLACGGGIGDADPDSSTPPDDPPGALPENCDQMDDVPTQVGEAPLRRLTHAEYDNTVADLLGDTTKLGRAFPPETPVHGFNNNVATQIVTFAQGDDYFRAAEKLAASAVTGLAKLAPCDVGQRGEETCARDFIDNFGRRAYRQPLTDELKDDLFTTYQVGRQQSNHTGGIRLVLTRMLASPYFLYRPEFGTATGPADGVVSPTPWETATRLSYALWATMPDQALFDAAANGQLESDDDVAGQVKRMLADPRAGAARRSFARGWLMLENLGAAKKDAALFPGFDELVPGFDEETSRLVEDVLGDAARPLGDLFTADYTFMNRAVASYLGIDGADQLTDTLARVSLAPDGDPGPGWRVGVLTTTALLAINSKPTETSPILRGRFIADQILCLQVPNAPGNVPPLPSGDQSDLTTRERFEVHAEASCASCHHLMDPLGFAFEHFDATGRFRATEKDKPIDASGELTNTDVDGPFANAIELSERIAGSQQMRSCVAQLWMRHGLGRDTDARDKRALDQLTCAVSDRNTTFADLVLAFTRSDSFRYLPAADGGQP